ncbi:hypothetical protein AGLY_016912 [Aphis glycines]|uniref:Uncharacterized protein n=1 Tax=Aphis glycines TaxID=307491 RepID=A0A6G0SWC0_APHGL|nr:hypothetical protein AGLY_016912 [Aphis glycines]
MEKAPIKRTYVLHTSNRSSTYRYFVSVDNVEKEVCRKFILSTLDISEKILRYTRDIKIDLYVSKHDNRGKQPSKIKTADVIIGNVDRFIQMLPAVPSHHCRGSSSIHVPKKDKCTFCEGFTSNETKTAEDILKYEHHIEEKKFTHKVFKLDQLRSGKMDFFAAALICKKC